MRTVPAELTERHEAAGWWTRETGGDLLAHRLDGYLPAQAGPSRLGEHGDLLEDR
jgi:hypothetical protein